MEWVICVGHWWFRSLIHSQLLVGIGIWLTALPGMLVLQFQHEPFVEVCLLFLLLCLELFKMTLVLVMFSGGLFKLRISLFLS